MRFTLAEVEAFEKLLRGRVPYTREETGSSTKLIAGRRRMFFADGEPFLGPHFQLIKQVKAAAGEYRGPRLPVRLFDFAPNRLPADSGEIDGVELDLSRAYLTVCEREKLLPRELVREIAALPKIYRLRVLGSMATKKQITEIDGAGKIVSSRQETLPAGLRLWSRICGEVGRDMFETAKRDADFLGFWVDNYFALKSGAARELRRRGYKVKVARAVFAWQHTPTGTKFNVDGERPFFFPRRHGRDAGELSVMQKKALDKMNDFADSNVHKTAGQ